jgi:TolA-binding protein
MSGTLFTTPWNVAPVGYAGPFGSAPPIGAQQLQQVQQAVLAQQQQLQQIQQVLQIVPQQIQQLMQQIQYLPQHVAQLLQQTLVQSSIGTSSPGLAGLGTQSPYGGLWSGQPFQSAQFGSPFPSPGPVTNVPFPIGQTGHVM